MALLLHLLLLGGGVQTSLAAAAREHGHGCQKKLDEYCPGWETEPKSECASCIHKHLQVRAS